MLFLALLFAIPLAITSVDIHHDITGWPNTNTILWTMPAAFLRAFRHLKNGVWVGKGFLPVPIYVGICNGTLKL